MTLQKELEQDIQQHAPNGGYVAVKLIQRRWVVAGTFDFVEDALEWLEKHRKVKVYDVSQSGNVLLVDEKE